MKKTLVAAILGIALNITTSHGQGYIVMQSYDLVGPFPGTPVFSGVGYTPGGPYVGAASGFKADLLYSLTGAPASFVLAAGSQTSFYVNGGVPSQDGGSPTTDGAGIFIGPTVIIPGYTSGPVTFIVEAYNGANYGQPGFYNGQSAPFVIPSLVTDPALPPGNILNIIGTTPTGLQPFVLVVPEPSIFALAGLSAAGLMAVRRKK
ncbi:MAG TPA: PEP-CTERM sorting domain-containing protein [Verrucomicrobiae bacterium]|nr:PEP-CTERM sorting domain-containing protein [Verrucomicrobiae bacterium]